MLTLKIKAGESLTIGDNIRLIVKGDASKGRVTIGIDAPRDLNIARVAPDTPEGDGHNI